MCSKLIFQLYLIYFKNVIITNIEAAPKKPCTLQCGTEVKHGYRSNGEGSDCCNTCSCNNGALSCTEIACGSQCEACQPGIHILYSVHIMYILTMYCP